MMGQMLIAGGLIFALMGLWVLAVSAGRAFALRHPELGRYREEGGGCGGACTCGSAGEAQPGQRPSACQFAASPRHVSPVTTEKVFTSD